MSNPEITQRDLPSRSQEILDAFRADQDAAADHEGGSAYEHCTATEVTDLNGRSGIGSR
jgi:hypothetical protein